MTTEENKKFYELFPETDICPACGGKGNCDDAEGQDGGAHIGDHAECFLCQHASILLADFWIGDDA